jgi:hypothetical protein
MRFAFGFVALLVVMGVVLYLSSSHTARDVESVRLTAASLREDVTPKSWDPRAASTMLETLSAFVHDPSPSRDELRRAADTAAGWAAGTSPGSNENHAAVKLRTAADELAQASEDLTDRHRMTASRCLDDARAALAGAPPNELDAVRGIRDQLENLQNSRREQTRELEQR